uniref:Cytochrome b5 heme-binding domain-containing protein n=1 Tax=Angiostrongylus cantonensis TaxID=6313 RepID=A0A0K0DM99_ANGCA
MSAEYSLVDVARHCVADDLWIVFDGKVFNMTSYLDSHPGGKAMLRQAGKVIITEYSLYHGRISYTKAPNSAA